MRQFVWGPRLPRVLSSRAHRDCTTINTLSMHTRDDVDHEATAWWPTAVTPQKPHICAMVRRVASLWLCGSSFRSGSALQCKHAFVYVSTKCNNVRYFTYICIFCKICTMRVPLSEISASNVTRDRFQFESWVNFEWHNPFGLRRCQVVWQVVWRRGSRNNVVCMDSDMALPYM